jgi:6-phosphogluconolactonase
MWNRLHTIVAALMLVSSAQAEPMNLYIGTYSGPSSEGIYRVGFDSATGEFTSEATLVAKVKNPSFLAFTRDAKRLYCVSEVGGGAVSAFAIDAHDAPLRHLNDGKSGGDGPCHLTVARDGKSLVVANYGSGHFAAMPLNGDGTVGAITNAIAGAGGGPVASRQKGPHGHSVVPVPGHDDLIAACDLGSDEISILRVTPDGAIERVSTSKSPAGAGPRLSIWSKDGKKLFVADELSNTLSIYRFDGTALSLVAQSDALPADVRTQVSLAHVVLGADERFAYVSIRDLRKEPPFRDAIAVFDVTDAGKPTVVQHAPVARVPRHFTITPDGKWLIVAGQKSGTLESHAIDPTTGRLAPAGKPVQAGIPVCVLAVP